ncbi:MAG TPA: ATP-binding protein [Abditibacteriaceae bacterium]|jgi:PAS domain S-box-containing protein
MTTFNPSQCHSQSRDERVLILAPVGRDAAMTARFLSEAGLVPQVCDDSATLCCELQHGCGLAFLTGEALTPESLHDLVKSVKQQPPWSDVPFVVLTSGGGQAPLNADALAALGEAGNVTLIERPVRAATLLSSIKSALRARRRQYDVRDHMAEQMRAKEALGQSEERLRIALDAAQLGAWQLDLATGHLNCTPRCKTNFGFPPDVEFSYDALIESIHPDDRGPVRAAAESAIHEHNDYRCEYRVLWPDGTEHWILAMGRANYDSQGRPYSMVGVTADITLRKNADNEREQLLTREQAARAEAETANRLKDEFLATVSHELRTPLMAILGWTSLLRVGQLDAATTSSALETIERNANSQVQLINDLLDVSRIISGQMRLNLQPIELAQIIEAALDAVRPAAEARGIELHSSLDPKADPVPGDADRLQQVVWNLLTNAVKFTPAGGKVYVSLQRTGSYMEITIRDTGKGIDPQFLPNVFDRFRQADQTSTRRHGGLGLGLSIVRQLVTLHGGLVEAQSEGEGKGATFVVRLPLTVARRAGEESERDPATTQNATAQYGAALDGATRLDDIRVLVVEDEPDTRDVLRTVLQQCGSQVVTADSAAEAMRVLGKWKPHVLVSDIGMPSQDGYALIKQVRALDAEHGGRVPAIALTAYAKEEDRTRALSAGFQMHVAKPVEPLELAAVVARLAARTGALT